MKQSFCFLALFCALYAGAQKTADPQRYGRTITPAELRQHLFIVASAEMEGRETATEGQRKAAAYLEKEFRRVGLEPALNGSYQQHFPVYQDSLTFAGMEVNGKRYELDKDFNINLSNYPATLAFSEVVYIPQNALADSVRKMNLAGKAVLIPAEGSEGRRFQMTPRLEAIRNGNPAAIISISGTYPRSMPASRKSSMTMSFFKRAMNPHQVTVSEQVANAITGGQNLKEVNAIRTYKANVLLDVMKLTSMLSSSNVAGILPGTDKKDEYLFITAHYDHLGKRDTVIYYGADDDGSGTVALIEIAEAFAEAKAKGHGPRRSIVFMAVSGEEKGLWGSEYYSENPFAPIEKTTANLNIDMIGRSDATRKPDTLNYVYVVGDDKISSELKPISEKANARYTKLQLDYKFNDPADPNRIYYRSDHYNFARKGVPIIFYYDGMLGADYHRPTDTPDKINYELMAKRAQLVFYTAWEMANRPDMLKRDLPLDQNIFNR